jgi:hypothetical protein
MIHLLEFIWRKQINVSGGLMLSPEESRKALLKLFRKKYIADLDQLFHVLETNSRMSVFRRLKFVGYLTSFTDAGRYYTLEDIPLFDSWGLWFHEGIGFSKAGTLKATVVEIVHSSISGMTPKEMVHLLKIQAPNTLHNALHGLVKSNQIGRQRLEGLCLYTDVHPDKAKAQIEERIRDKQRGLQSSSPPSTETTIAVLVEALKAGKVILAPTEIVARLAVRGLAVTVEQVEQIFSRHGIQAGKKTLKYH